MGKSRCYYDRYRLGTTLVGMPETVSRLGSTTFVGIDRRLAGVTTYNPNYAMSVTAILAFHNANWTQRHLYAHFTNINRAVMDHSETRGSGWLTWVDSDDETTTTSNPEVAGDAVEVEVANVSALNVNVDDYILFIPPASLSPLDLDDPAEVCKVTQVGIGSVTVESLASNLPAGSTVYRVFIAYEEAVFMGADLGQPNEQAQDTFRFVTSWLFAINGNTVLSASYGYDV